MRFLLQPKRAIILKCRNCPLELWLKSKHGYTDNMCPACETKSLFIDSNDIPAIKLEYMYRFLVDDEKLECFEEEHDSLMGKYYDLGCGCPCSACNDDTDDENDVGFPYELSDEIRERLK